MILPILRQNLQTLESLKSDKESIRLDAQKKIKATPRNSFLNFLRRLISVITCMRVSCNKSLDSITQSFINEVGQFKHVSKTDKILIDNAFKNLAKVNDNNGGRFSKLVLATAQKIQSLSETNQLVSNSEVHKPINSSEVHKPISSSEVHKPIATKANPTAEALNPVIDRKPLEIGALPKELQEVINNKENNPSLEKLIKHAEFLLNYPQVEVRENGLQALVRKIEINPHHLIAAQLCDHQQTFATLFSQFNPKVKESLLALALWEAINQNKNLDLVFKSAALENEQIWEKAISNKLYQINKSVDFSDLAKTALAYLPFGHLKILIDKWIHPENKNIFQLMLDYYFAGKAPLDQQQQFLKQQINLPSFEKDDQGMSPWIQFIQALDSLELNPPLTEYIQQVMNHLIKNNLKDRLLDFTPKLLQLLQLEEAADFQKSAPHLCLMIIVKTKQLTNSTAQPLLQKLFTNLKFLEGGTAMAPFLQCFNTEEEVPYLMDLIQWLHAISEVKKQRLEEEEAEDFITRLNKDFIRDNLRTLNVEQLNDITKYHTDYDYQSFNNYLLTSIFSSEEKILHENVQLKCHRTIPYVLLSNFVLQGLNKPINQFLPQLLLLNSKDKALHLIYKINEIVDLYKKDSPTLIPYEKILPSITNSTHLWRLFTPIINHNDSRYYEVIFKHLEKEPWQAYMTSGLYNEHQTDWLKQRKDQFPQCHYILIDAINEDEERRKKNLNPKTAKKSRESCVVESIDINQFFKKEKFDEQLHFFHNLTPTPPTPENLIQKSLSIDVKPYLLSNARFSLPENLINDLLSMPLPQLSIALNDEIARKNIFQALSLKNHPLYEHAKERVLNHIDQNIAIKDIEDAKNEKNKIQNKEIKIIIMKFRDSIL